MIGPGVKFCGMTRPEDARVAADLGAAGIGFIFWPRSPRAVTPDRARDIVAVLPAGIERVGVFVNASVEEMHEVSSHVGLTAVQLHGDETPDMARPLRPPVIKAISRAEQADAWPADVLLLVDAPDVARRGGTGMLADWQQANLVADRRRIMLAGGLTARNVIEAIHWVTPCCLDVSSGVEVSPGIKDHAKMREFMQTVEQARRCLPCDEDIRRRMRVQFAHPPPAFDRRSPHRSWESW